MSPSVSDSTGSDAGFGSDSDADTGPGSVSDSGQRQSPVDPAESNSQN